jgi:hypothetical protein
MAAADSADQSESSEANFMFSLNGMSDAVQRERHADMLREAERERVFNDLEDPFGRGPLGGGAAILRWIDAARRICRPAFGQNRRTTACAG